MCFDIFVKLRVISSPAWSVGGVMYFCICLFCRYCPPDLLYVHSLKFQGNFSTKLPEASFPSVLILLYTLPHGSAPTVVTCVY